MSSRGSLPICSRHAYVILLKLFEPYSDNPETRGFMRLSTELLNEIIPNFLRDGWQVVSLVTVYPRFLYANLVFFSRTFTPSEIGQTQLSWMRSRMRSKTRTSLPCVRDSSTLSS